MAFTYHTKTYQNEYDIQRLENVYEGIKHLGSGNGRMIEFGCNNGTITSTLANHFSTVLAIDADPKLLEEAKSNVINDNVRWLEHDLNFPLPHDLHKRYDVAVALEVIEHLDSPEFFLDQIRLVLRNEGRLLISTPNLFSPEGITGALRAWKNGSKYLAWDESHKSLFTSIRLIRLLKRKGFHPVRIAGYHYDTCELPFFKKKLQMPFRAVSWPPLNMFGFNIVVEAIHTGRK